MNLIDVSYNAEKNKDEDDDEEDVAHLLRVLPTLKDLFDVHGKIGEGTFSSVFLATLKSSDRERKFAIKYLLPTCHPSKIERELQCLQEIGGTDYVVGLELCLRHIGSVAFVMPYMRHDRFSDYIHVMSVDEIRDYMRALLTAIRRVHKFNIIHRDVKPSNFLYNRSNRRYLLVDFGLAQQYVETKSNSNFSTRSVKRKRSDENIIVGSPNIVEKSAEVQCSCFGKPRMCSICFLKPSQAAPRAGTPGFRAPEVLLKYPLQTPAIDVWASGIMMLCILSGTQPFFRSPDDCTALAEITSIFGSDRIQQCARKLGRKIIFSDSIPGIDIVSLCQRLRKRNKIRQDENAFLNLKKVSQDTIYPMAAYDLLVRLLDPDYKTRITAEEALNHPFLKL